MNMKTRNEIFKILEESHNNILIETKINEFDYVMWKNGCRRIDELDYGYPALVTKIIFAQDDESDASQSSKKNAAIIRYYTEFEILKESIVLLKYLTIFEQN